MEKPVTMFWPGFFQAFEKYRCRALQLSAPAC